MNWPIATLGRVVLMVGGGTPSKQNDTFWNGTIPWVSPKDMRDREIRDADDHITEAALDGSATQVVPVGSVLVVVRSGILVRRLPIAITRAPVALNQDMKALLPGGPLIPEFLAYALEARAEYVLAECVKRGATVHSIDVGKFQQMQLPVPAEPEQRRIVEILDQADALRRLRAEADAKAERVLPALFLKIFGDPATNPKGWRVLEMGNVLESSNYGSMIPPSAEGTWLDIRVANIQDGKLDLSSKKYIELDERTIGKHSLRDGDILLARAIGSREHLGKAIVVYPGKDRWAFDSHLMRVRVRQEQVLPEYVTAFLASRSGRREFLSRTRASVVQFNINTTEFASIRIPVPPIESQNRFKRDALLFLEHNRRTIVVDQKLDALFACLLSRAFSGGLTASWRTAHMKELLQEMEQQSSALSCPVEPEVHA